MSSPLRSPLSPLVPLILGLAFIAAAVALNLQQRALQQDDVRGIAILRAQLDSVRAAHARASTAADSSRLAENIAARTYGIGRREFHVPSRQEFIDRWWTLTGLGTALSAVGALFIAAAVFARRTSRRTPP